MSNEHIGRRAAEAFRREFELGAQPIVSMARLIERTMNTGVAWVPASEPGHGMTMRHNGHTLIAVGCTPNPMRMRSTLAHELGHLRLGSVDRALKGSVWDERTPEEIQADAFARHLLVPQDGIRERAAGKASTIGLLSELVQTFLASPGIVAIQLRDVGVIDDGKYTEWRDISARSLATKFGWSGDYEALSRQSAMPRAPQALMALAIEAYSWGLIKPAAIARLWGERDLGSVVRRFEEQGIVPQMAEAITPSRPTDTGARLTAEELAVLSDSAG